MNSVAPSMYHDFSGLADLKRQARDDQGASAEKVARQFESVFVQMMVKQMRQANFGGGLLDSQQTKFAQDMYDQQLAVHLSEQRGLGMLPMLRSQLGAAPQVQQQELSGLESYWQNPATLARRHGSNVAPVKPSEGVEQTTQKIDSPEDFVTRLWSCAEQAAEELGLPPEALLAQAALETGWGGHVMQSANGNNSHNLFGIKADQRWDGDQVRKETLEYQEDIAVRRRENFRSYSSFDESFQDYVAFLKQNPRYSEALSNTQDSESYFRALQDAGYATDPEYANKILRVMQGPEMQAALDHFKSSAQQPI
ncbi:MAG: flagellar assembly peptidoglycan hydrolase FlgJ [Candidatus Thiodiazotropha sp. 6PLUC2]